MVSSLTTSLVLFLLGFSFSVSAGQRIITAEPGDNVILTCRAAENKDVIVVEWRRTDLESDHYVLLYRDSQFDPEGQPPSFRNRVDLLDVENGDVSLVLKNVTTDDTGTYECRVVQRGNNHRKRSLLDTEPISIINLRVEPGNKEKQEVDGGNKDGQKEDGGNKDGPQEDGRKRAGLKVGLSVFPVVVLLLAAVVVIFLCRGQIPSSPRPNTPSASEDEPEQTTTGL